MRFLREQYSEDLVSEMLPLWKAHWMEIAHYRDITLNPDLSGYEAMARLGGMRIYTARQEGRLVGYQVFFVHPNPHYLQSLQAVQDILFIHLDFRKGLSALRFIKWCDSQLALESVQVVYQHLKARHDFGKMLERIGYERQDIVYSRRLD